VLTTSIAQPIYSSRIIKATALLPDTRALLLNWDESQSAEDNLSRMRAENLFGKASRSRIADMLAIFKQRYLGDAVVMSGLVALAKGGLPNDALDRILYFLSARNDALLHDAVTEFLLPAYQRGQTEVTTDKVVAWLRDLMRDDRMGPGRAWSDETTLHVAQHLLTTLRDFGVLQGTARKRITLPYLPLTSFCFIAYLRQRELTSGELLLHDSEWGLFFLPSLGVERMFLEAHQEHLLEYHAAGRIIRIEFPSPSLHAYGQFILNRSHPPA
jgi:hypothetical protein